MFLNNKKKSAAGPEINEAAKAKAQLEGDLIVHNMPNQAKLRPASVKVREQAPINFNSAVPPKHNFKSVGLVIIIGGILFIIVLTYLSYRFIVSPNAKPNNQSVPAPVSTETKPLATSTSPDSPAVVPATADIATVTPASLDLTATTTNTAEGIMNEELTGKNISDLPPLLDSDQDGLNDREEALLGTNSAVTDSNGNSYPDLIEVNNNYNPAGSGRLTANNSLAKYDNPTIGYEILYPKDWPFKTLADGATTVFTMPDDSLVQISVQDNPNKAGILSWYEGSFPGVVVTYDKLKSADTWDGISGEDNLNFYLTDKEHANIFVISYVPAVSGYVVYPNIFKLMINSFSIK